MNPKYDFSAMAPSSHTAAEHREAVQRAEQERTLERQRELDSQVSMDNGPAERIRIWERLHAVRLPMSSSHPLLAVIAAQTQLSVRQVMDEQHRRAAPAGTAPPAAKISEIS